MTGTYQITLTGYGIYGTGQALDAEADRLAKALLKRLSDASHQITNATFTAGGRARDLKAEAGLGASAAPAATGASDVPITGATPPPVMGGTTVEPPPSESEIATLMQRTMAALGMPAGDTPQGAEEWPMRRTPEWAGKIIAERDELRLQLVKAAAKP